MPWQPASLTHSARLRTARAVLQPSLVGRTVLQGKIDQGAHQTCTNIPFTVQPHNLSINVVPRARVALAWPAPLTQLPHPLTPLSLGLVPQEGLTAGRKKDIKLYLIRGSFFGSMADRPNS